MAAVTLLCVPACSQEPTTPQQEQAHSATGASGTVCLEPPPMIRWQDYNGPLAKLVGTVGAKVERRAIHEPNYKPGDALCSLGMRDKFILFVEDTIDPITIATVAFSSALDQAENSEPRFGQGMQGYGKRWDANEASDASGRFFSEFLFPTVLSEDPRYYRLGRGSGGRRLLHALEHAVVAHRDHGGRMPNISEWAGTTSGVLLSDLYHPGTTHGPSSVASQVGWNILEDTGFDVLREFWPEIARKFHVPFRSASEPVARPVK